MENIILDTTATVTQELTNSELDTVRGGESHFIATLVATLLNTVDPQANCTVSDNNKVKCLN